MKNYYYYSGFSDYCHLYCYIHNVSADESPGLLQLFLVELESLCGTSNVVLYLIHKSGLTGYKC